MTQFKHLAGMFASAESGTPEEKHLAKKFLTWILSNVGDLDADESLLTRLMFTANKTADSGCDRCECGCKYWENDLCIDCGTAWDVRHRHGA